MKEYSAKTLIRYSLLGIFVGLVMRKVIIGKVAMDYVQQCKNQVDFEAMVI